MDRHSRWVRILTIALPLLAVGMLVLVFTRDWTSSEEVKDQFVEEDRQFNPELQAQVEQPTLSARNSEGDEINLRADSLEQASDGNDALVATGIESELQVGGSEWQIESTEGETDTQGRVAEFRGRVLALIDGEYNVLGSQVIADVTERTFTSEFPIEVESERFDLAADAAVMSGASGTRVIELDGNVKGVIRLGEYEPDRSEESAENDAENGNVKEEDADAGEETNG